MPYLPAERDAHTTLLDRMLGTVDLREGTEYLMFYTSFARQVGAGMIWSSGASTQAIAVGSTEGDEQPGMNCVYLAIAIMLVLIWIVARVRARRRERRTRQIRS